MIFFKKTYKISEQQPILAIIMKNPKMANIVYRQMPTPRELRQQEVVMYEIDTCITWLQL